MTTTTTHWREALGALSPPPKGEVAGKKRRTGKPWTYVNHHKEIT
jgi:hypothetical protein